MRPVGVPQDDDRATIEELRGAEHGLLSPRSSRLAGFLVGGSAFAAILVAGGLTGGFRAGPAASPSAIESASGLASTAGASPSAAHFPGVEPGRATPGPATPSPEDACATTAGPIVRIDPEEPAIVPAGLDLGGLPSGRLVWLEDGVLWLADAGSAAPLALVRVNDTVTASVRRLELAPDGGEIAVTVGQLDADPARTCGALYLLQPDLGTYPAAWALKFPSDGTILATTFVPDLETGGWPGSLVHLEAASENGDQWTHRLGVRHGDGSGGGSGRLDGPCRPAADPWPWAGLVPAPGNPLVLVRCIDAVEIFEAGSGANPIVMRDPAVASVMAATWAGGADEVDVAAFVESGRLTIRRYLVGRDNPHLTLTLDPAIVWSETSGQMAMAPTGGWAIAEAAEAGPGPGGPARALYRVDLGTGATRRITSGELGAPTIAGDGTTVLYLVGGTTGSRLIARSDGGLGQPVTIASFGSVVDQVVWLP